MGEVSDSLGAVLTCPAHLLSSSVHTAPFLGNGEGPKIIWLAEVFTVPSALEVGAISLIHTGHSVLPTGHSLSDLALLPEE